MSVVLTHVFGISYLTFRSSAFDRLQALSHVSRHQDDRHEGQATHFGFVSHCSSCVTLKAPFGMKLIKHEASSLQELALRRTKCPELVMFTSRQPAACGATIVVVHGAEAHGPHNKFGLNRSRQHELMKQNALSVRVAHDNTN